MSAARPEIPTYSSPASNAVLRLEPARQGRIGLVLAALIMGAWAATHIYAIFFFQLTATLTGVLSAVGLAGLLCWLYVGLFIIAHDCMHGSLVPFRPAVNRAIGWLCLTVYAGFDYDGMNRKHHLHHRHAGTEGDPDFDARQPHGFWAWYFKFFTEYFSGREIVIIAAQVGLYLLIGASLANIWAFWVLPAVLSSLQLFTFGTYLPHRPDDPAFSDRHKARSNRFSWLASLMTCFHFGYHHEHHEYPALPWWRLPAAHALPGAPDAGVERR
jgi:beta-carotene/zeaxanthin 4-ketolase